MPTLGSRGFVQRIRDYKGIGYFPEQEGVFEKVTKQISNTKKTLIAHAKHRGKTYQARLKEFGTFNRSKYFAFFKTS